MSPRAEKALVTLLVAVAAGSIFGFAQQLNEHVATPGRWWQVTALDRALPVVPASAWIYVSWYVAPVLLLRHDRVPLRRVALALVLCYLVSGVGWLGVPTVMERASLDGLDGPSVRLLRAVYRMDPPANIFPSVHAALAALVTGTPVAGLAARCVLWAWMIAIWASCVLTKQHYVLDVVAGIGLGFSALAAVGLAARHLAFLRDAPSHTIDASTRATIAPSAHGHRDLASPAS